MNPIRVLFVDDHWIIRQGLRSLLEPDPRFIVVGEASNGMEALRNIEESQPEIVILDLKLGDMGGAELCKRIVQAHPKTIVLILTAYIDQNSVETCLRAGARGYLLKDAENLHLKDELISAVLGHAALDPRAADVLTDFVQRQQPSPQELNLREMDILRLVAQGLTNKEIGSSLHLTENTVKGYVKEILFKLDARNRIEAVLHANSRGLL
jgi:DNA-binding NarL/FixJ family response regulator